MKRLQRVWPEFVATIIPLWCSPSGCMCRLESLHPTSIEARILAHSLQREEGQPPPWLPLSRYQMDRSRLVLVIGRDGGRLKRFGRIIRRRRHVVGRAGWSAAVELGFGRWRRWVRDPPPLPHQALSRASYRPPWRSAR